MSDALHAFVLPNTDFRAWLTALRPYLAAFERVIVVRGATGNDLNPYRNVTAVAAPRTWLRDNPLTHIRSIYPSVVRVDVIRATTPDQMGQILQARINANDRYGETLNADDHLYDRFVLDWPVDYRPMRITQRFDDARETVSVGLASVAGAAVEAAVAGTVTKQWAGTQSDALGLGRYVQVTTIHDGVPFIVTYAGLSTISVPLNTQVETGDKLGEAEGNSVRVMVQHPDGLKDRRLPDVLNPTALLYVNNLRVRPTVASLRVRAIPTLDGDIIAGITPIDPLIPADLHGRVLEKVGTEGEWLRLRLLDGRYGWVAAWFMESTQPRPVFTSVNQVGINLDERHPLGKPQASRLGNIGWVRFNYNVSRGFGSEDINNAYNRYAPLAEHYARAGFKVLFTTSHQTYGEAKGYHWPAVTDVDWRNITARFADMMRRIAQQWAANGTLHAWQIWNEQDAPIGARSSVPMSASNYSKMLREVVPAIRSAQNDVFVLTGGHISGPVAGSNYASAALNVLPANAVPDGVALHPYGRDTEPNSTYGQFGHIDESLQQYTRVIKDRPVWITEWGVLDRPNDDPNAVAAYATRFIKHIKTRWNDEVACMIWYAWAQGMDNGYGIVDGAGNPRPSLTDQFLNA